MAMLTCSHGSPSNLRTNRVKYITVYLKLNKLFKYKKIKVLPDNLAEGVCCFSWFAACDDAHSHKESAGHNQSPHSHDGVGASLLCNSPRVLSRLCGRVCVVGLYGALHEEEHHKV